MSPRFLGNVCNPNVYMYIYVFRLRVNYIYHPECTFPHYKCAAPRVSSNFGSNPKTLVWVSPSGPLANFLSSLWCQIFVLSMWISAWGRGNSLQMLDPGCCGMTVVSIFVRKFHTNIDVCAGALSCWGIGRFAFQDSGLFFFMDPSKRLKTSK
jgi:hypothetical protein